MANPKIPLNLFKRVSTTLLRSGSAIYTTPFDRASVLINTFVTNNTNFNRFITVELSGTEQPLNTFINKFPLNLKDAINITPQKIILQEGDTLLVKGDINDLATLEQDEDIFWEFDIPFTNVTLNDLVVEFTNSTQISADSGGGEISFNTNIVELTSNVPVSYTYDLDNNTDVNVTLSILEAINTV